MSDAGLGAPVTVLPPLNSPTKMMYVEQCIPGALHAGDAWIGRVTYSKSGRSIYYRGMRLKVIPVSRVGGANYRDVVTGVGYWVTGVKHRGSNRHPQDAARPIHIDDDVREEYEALRKSKRR